MAENQFVGGLVMVFDAMLMSVKQGEYVSTEGRNKGTKYEWSELEFNNAKEGTFRLKTTAPVVIDPSKLRVEYHWELQIVPKDGGNKGYRVSNVVGSKIK